MTDELRAKVIQLVDQYRIIIDKGKKDGVRIGDRFVVYTPIPVKAQPDEIRDVFEIRKAEVAAEQVGETSTLCISAEVITRGPLDYLLPFSRISERKKITNAEVEDVHVVVIGDMARRISRGEKQTPRDS